MKREYLPIVHFNKLFKRLLKFCVLFVVIKLILGYFGNRFENHLYVKQLIIVCSEMVDILIISNILKKLLNPINPIYFSNHFIYDTPKKEIFFRYWIMMREGKYLYDIDVRVRLIRPSVFQVGENKIKAEWQSVDKNITNLSYARGIRYIVLSQNESKELKRYLDNKEYNDCIINVVISGKTNTGKVFTKFKDYKPQKLKIGYRFVPLQEHEYMSELYYKPTDNNREENWDKKREMFCYHHFNMVTRLKGKSRSEENEHESEAGFSFAGNTPNKKYPSLLRNLKNFIIMGFLDRSHFISYIRGK